MARVELLATGVKVDAVIVNQRDNRQVEAKTGRTVNTWISTEKGLISVDPSGVIGDMHYGGFRTQGPNDPAEVRGESVLNNRGIVVADFDHMRAIAEAMDLPIDKMVNTAEMPIEHLMAGFMAVNVLVKTQLNGLAFEQYVVPSAKMHLMPGCVSPEVPNVVSVQLWVNELTSPCFKPPANISCFFSDRGIKGPDKISMIRSFKEASAQTRGWVCMAIAGGQIMVGDQLMVEMPNNPYEANQ